MSSRTLCLIVVFAAALLGHARARQGGFVFFDDPRFVTQNPAIREVGNPARFFTDIETTAQPEAPTKDIYRPIRTLSFALIHANSGMDPRAFHTWSIVLHAVCALLLAMVLMAAGLPVWPAGAGALFWALHPTTVEVTAWVCSLGDVWCGLFSLLAILLYGGGRGAARLVLAHVALVLALFSKEHAVVVPGLWLAWDFCLRRDRLKSGIRTAVAPGLVIAIGFLVLRHQLGLKLTQIDEPLGGSFGEAVATMLAGLGWYAKTILLPFGSTFQARVEWTLPGILIGLLVLGGLVFMLVKGDRHVRVATGWFLIALVPVSNLFVTLKIPTADRFLYLPLMGLAVLVAAACRRWPRPAVWAAPAALLLLAGVTQTRIGDWKDSDALYEAGTRVDPKSRMLIWYRASREAQAALRLIDQRDFQRAELKVNEAVQYYERYLRNAKGEDTTTQVWMELGELMYVWGDWMQRLDQRPAAIRAWGSGLEAFLAAHKLQVAGKGRVIEEEVRMAADRASMLCVKMADPENPYLDRIVSVGEEMLRFLDARYGGLDVALRLRFVQLRLVYTTQIRVSDPGKAREGFTQILKILDSVEGQGHDTRFLRAQALLYRAIIPPYNRAEIERAYELFRQVAGAHRALAVQATFLMARCCCVIAKLFDDKAMEEKGRAILDELPKYAERNKLTIPEYTQRQIIGERQGCHAGRPPPPKKDEKDK